MNKYHLMNKILEEEGTYELSEAEEISFAEHEADEYIDKMETQSESDAGWQWEWYK